MFMDMRNLLVMAKKSGEKLPFRVRGKRCASMIEQAVVSAQCFAVAIVRQLCAQSRHALAQSSMPPTDSQLMAQASHTSAHSAQTCR